MPVRGPLAAVGSLLAAVALSLASLQIVATGRAQDGGGELPAAEPPTGAGVVARAQFTSLVRDREPVDLLTRTSTNVGRLYFFTELVGMTGRTVTHRWLYFDEPAAEIPFEIGGPRWRVFSYKTLQPSLAGEWSVELVDERGRTIDVFSILVAHADANPAASPAAPTVETAARRERAPDAASDRSVAASSGPGSRGDAASRESSTRAERTTPSSEARQLASMPGEEPCCTIRASRVFSGPSQYPPETFAAYGIVAFRAAALDTDRARHLMFCNAYVASLPHADKLFDMPLEAQMVTVWPISSDALADALNRASRSEVCERAVGGYGLPVALRAIRLAEKTGLDARRPGPFLLAWSPAAGMGQPDAPVLVVDLTDVTTYEEARDVFVDWAIDIERDPSLWHAGFDTEYVLVKIRRWADKYGPLLIGMMR